MYFLLPEVATRATGDVCRAYEANQKERAMRDGQLSANNTREPFMLYEAETGDAPGSLVCIFQPKDPCAVPDEPAEEHLRNAQQLIELAKLYDAESIDFLRAAARRIRLALHQLRKRAA